MHEVCLDAKTQPASIIYRMVLQQKNEQKKKKIIKNNYHRRSNVSHRPCGNQQSAICETGEF